MPLVQCGDAMVLDLEIPGHMSVQEARLHRAYELSRQTEEKLAEAREAGRAAAAGVYEADVAYLREQIARVRDLVLRAQRALPVGGRESYDLLKEAMYLTSRARPSEAQHG